MKIWPFLILALCNTAMAAPDEEILGKSLGYPLPKNIVFPWADQFKVGVFSNRAALSPHCLLPASNDPLILRNTNVAPAFSYTYQNQNFSLEDYLNRRRVTGLLILKDEEILVERYAYERNAKHKMLGNSMTKSLIALAVGQALAQKKIKTLEDAASVYVPELTGTAYGETKIINLLRMSSGVKFTENYSGKDDLATFHTDANSTSVKDALKRFNERVDPEGTKFRYVGLETRTLALAVEGAVGKPICEYIGENVWSAIGSEDSATWIYENKKKDINAAGDFSATLRDWARVGFVLANDGVIKGRSIFDKEYLLNMTDVKRQPRAFWPKIASPLYGYGFQIWLLDSPTGKRRFFLQGIYGQAVFVDPELKLVMVQTVVEKAPGGTGIIPEGEAVFQGVVRKYGRW